jgi:hypothetical protein
MFDEVNIKCFTKEFISRFETMIEKIEQDMSEFGINYYFTKTQKKAKTELPIEKKNSEDTESDNEENESENEEDKNIEEKEEKDKIILKSKFSINVKDKLVLEKEPFAKASNGALIYKGYGEDMQVRAIKKIPINSDYNLNIALSEIQLLCELNHKNIIRYYSAVKDDNFFYIVLDLIYEGSLEDRIKIIKNEKKAQYIHDLCDSILYIHHKSIVHLNLIPKSNHLH